MSKHSSGIHCLMQANLLRRVASLKAETLELGGLDVGIFLYILICGIFF